MTIASIDRTLPTLEENLALDEALLLEAESGDDVECLRLWEWPGLAAIIGAGGVLQSDADVPNCERDGVPIKRRASGGGAVLLGPGCLLFSLVLRFDRHRDLKDVKASYRYILGRMINALRPIGQLELAGISDLTFHGRKCSGNAQQRKRDHVLHHGSLLFNFDLKALGRYLRQPAKQPAYRADRPHDLFVTNLPASREQLSQMIADEWEAVPALPDLPESRVAELVEGKYSLDSWNARR